MVELETTRATQRLIELVRGDPSIYDQRLKTHRDRDYISNFWKSVEKEIALPHWTEEKCRRKWKNLRDTFRRKLYVEKSRKSRQGATKETKWLFYESLGFLIPYMANPAPDSNIHSDSQTEHSFEDFEEDETLSTASVDRSLPATSIPYVAKRVKNNGDNTRESPLNEHSWATQTLSEQISQQNSFYHKSDSQVFLESFATRMDALPSHIQSVLRIQIAQIFHNAENVGIRAPIPLTPFQSDSD